MRVRAVDVRRYLMVLDLRGQGLSQSAVARITNMHPDTIARIERRFRRGTLRLPPNALLGAIKTEYDGARSQAIRAQLLSKLVDLAVEGLRTRLAEAELKKLQSITVVVDPTDPPRESVPAAVTSPPSPAPRSRFAAAAPDAFQRAAVLLDRLLPGAQ